MYSTNNLPPARLFLGLIIGNVPKLLKGETERAVAETFISGGVDESLKVRTSTKIPSAST
jgi:hypothetical protein